VRVEPVAGAAAAYQGMAVVGYPVYNASLLQARADALRDVGRQDPPPGLPGLEEFTQRRNATFRVAAVASGGRADMFDLQEAVFVRLDEAQDILGRPGQVNLLKFSNPGDERAGEAGTDTAMEALEAALAPLKEDRLGVPSLQALEAKPLKREYLAQADAKGQTLTGLLVFASSLSILTGLLLIVNLFTMLAEERRSELGVARAVGLARGDLVRLTVLEGSLYAVAAAAIGSLAGLGLAYVMVTVMDSIVSRLSRDLSFPPIGYSPSWEAFAVAFAVGALLTFATILAASRRQARLNVVRAIRRLEEPEHSGSRRTAFSVGAPLAALGLTASILAWTPAGPTLFFGREFTAQVLAPVAAAVGLGILLRPFTRRQVTVPLRAAALAAYQGATLFLVTEFRDPTEANILGPLRGVLLTLATVVVVTHAERPLRALGNLLGRIRGMRPLALPALSYPLHRKFRTGMTVAMFSVVLLAIGFFSIFGALFQVDPARQTGGFEVEARTTLHVADIDAGAHDVPHLDEAILARHELPEYRSEDRAFLTVSGAQTGTFRDYRHAVYGYDEAFAQAQRFHLMERLPKYATDLDAYLGVLASEGTETPEVIVSYVYSTSPAGQAFAHHVGERLELNFGGQGAKTFVIAGIQEQYHFPGVFLPRDTVEGLFPATPRLHLYELAPAADAQAVARDLERRHRAVGLDARSTVDEVLEEQASFRQLLGAMKLFLGLGLVVGVLSLGIVTSRSVLERRQEIGMMRALGYTGRQVRRVFFLEATTTILLSTLVGIACALLVTYGLWSAVVRRLNYPYIVPWLEIVVLVGVSYAAALLATWGPIGRTAKVPPAEALRYVE
jgi:putative ABC transport system permease protein